MIVILLHGPPENTFWPPLGPVDPRLATPLLDETDPFSSRRFIQFNVAFSTNDTNSARLLHKLTAATLTPATL